MTSLPFSTTISITTAVLGALVAAVIISIYCYRKQLKTQKEKTRKSQKEKTRKSLPPLKIDKIKRNKYQLAPTEPPRFVIPPYLRSFSAMPDAESEDEPPSDYHTFTVPMTPADPALLQAPSRPIQRAMSENTMQSKTEAKRKKSSLKSKSPHGKLEVNVQYVFGKNYLSIHVKGTIDLPMTGRMSGLTTPYVKVYLLPGGDHSKYHPIKSHCIDLSSHSMCVFEKITFQEAQSSVLKLVVLDYDRFSRTEFVAEAMVQLDELDLKEGTTVCRQLMTQQRNVNMDRGSLLVSLCFQPMAEQLAVIILKAEGISKIESGAEFYAKVFMHLNGELREKFKTKSLKGSAVFNEPFLFKARENDLKNVCVTCELYRGDKRLGQVNLGLESFGTEIRHWNEMMLSPQKQIAESHALRE